MNSNLPLDSESMDRSSTDPQLPCFFLDAVLVSNNGVIRLSSNCISSTTCPTPWEARSRSAGQGIPQIFSKPKLHYRAKKSPSLYPILCQKNSFHTLTPYLHKIHFNIILNPHLYFQRFQTRTVYAFITWSCL